jgi:hypothetical protein
VPVVSSAAQAQVEYNELNAFKVVTLLLLKAPLACECLGRRALRPLVMAACPKINGS